jgi:hypothetical protein
MTTIIRHPDTPITVLPEGSRLDTYAVSLRRLRAAITSDDAEWPRSLAMAWLNESDFPNKHRDYEKVLHDARAGIVARCLAAHYLGRSDSPAAPDILVAALETGEEPLRSAVLAALARVGGLAALRAIQRNCGVGGGRAAFALATIACRHDLDEFDLPAIEGQDRAPCSAGEFSPFQIESASPAEVELCLRCLGPRPFSIELAERPAYQIRCGDEDWIILFNQELATAEPAGILPGRKHFVAIVARRAPPDGRYAEALIVLAKPGLTEGRGEILVYRAGGSLAMAGAVAFEGGAARFELRSTARPRAFSVEIKGALESGRLELVKAHLGPGEKQEATRTLSPGAGRFKEASRSPPAIPQTADNEDPDAHQSGLGRLT